MFNKFVERPILSSVISIFFVILGFIALTQLPLTQFPEIAPPAVTITTRYTGANAEVCSKAVVTPIERAVNGVPGMTYMTSVSGNDGKSIITVYFEVGTDPDIAAVNVQNRVTTVLDQLPEEVIKSGVTTEKEVNSILLYINLTTTDTTTSEEFVFNFTDINIISELKRINGVGLATIMGQRDYAMRVWLKPERMNNYNISSDDVIKSLKTQNVEAAPGKIGESSGKYNSSLQFVLKYTGKFISKEQYENIVIKSTENGEILKLKDIADIEFGSQSYEVVSKENGRPSAAIILKQRPGTNANEIIKNVKAKMEELKSKTFPAGMNYTISYDVSKFLDASIHEVIKTLIEAFILVALVVFIFLQDFRSTLIPILAIPVSLIGTLFFIWILGFSLNMLTLFALVLSIGIVVDNAIVVVEAVHANMQTYKMNPFEATIKAMSQISSAIVSITLVMSAVFIPVAFLSGPIGVFYRQFSITMAISIVISGITALTFTPALTAIMLNNDPHHQLHEGIFSKFFQKFNSAFDRFTDWYGTLLTKYAVSKKFTWIVLLIFIAGTVLISNVLPSGFIPNEDQGTIYANITTPSGATVERTKKVTEYIESAAKEIESIENISTLAGYSMVTEGNGASYGMSMFNLKPWDKRDEDVKEITQKLKEKTSHIKDAVIQFYPPPAVPGYGNTGGFELRIQDRTGSGNLKKLEEVSKNLIAELNKTEEIENAFTSFDASFPQYIIRIDYDKAAQKGISVETAMDNLQTLIGSYYATNFIRFGQMYKVMVQSLPEYRSKPEDILNLYVKNNRDELVQYSSFASVEKVLGCEQITRYNMFNAALITGDAAKGYSSGDVIKVIEKVAAEKLPRGYFYQWSGMTRDEILSGNQTLVIYSICLLFVYLLLAAQYESFFLPIPVIISLPVGIFGTYFLLLLFGLENNIYAQVAVVMLIGLLGKNAILVIEFAVQKQIEEKCSVITAAKEGAIARLRPILMTSFAFTAGLIPLMLASGAGAIGNKTIGTAAAGGMLFGTIFGLIIIPGLYIIFASLDPKLKAISNAKKL